MASQTSSRERTAVQQPFDRGCRTCVAVWAIFPLTGPKLDCDRNPVCIKQIDEKHCATARREPHMLPPRTA